MQFLFGGDALDFNIGSIRAIGAGSGWRYSFVDKAERLYGSNGKSRS